MTISAGALSGLIGELGRAGFQVGISERVKIDSVLVAMAASGRLMTADGLEGLLAPLLCRSAPQQQDFHAIFRRWLPALDGSSAIPPRTVKAAPLGTDRAAVETGADDSVSNEAKRRRWRILVLAIAALLLMTAIYVIRSSVEPSADIIQPGQQTLDNNASANLQNPSAGAVTSEWMSPGRIAGFLVPWVLFALFLAHDRQREAGLQRRYVADTSGEEPLKLASEPEHLIDPTVLRRGFGALRSPIEIRSDDIDVPATIRATVGAFSLPTVVHANRREQPTHLLLVQRIRPDDMLAAFGTQLSQFLQREGLATFRFEFRVDPRTCRSAGGEYVTLSTLAARFPNARLMIVGTGDMLLDPQTRDPLPWTGDLGDWTERVILTPRPPSQWGTREQSLIDLGFKMFPANSSGIAVYAAGLAGGYRYSLVRGSVSSQVELRGQRLLQPLRPPETTVQELIGELRRDLGAAGFALLCATAVFPRVNPGITGYLAARLRNPDKTPMIDEASAMALAGLPWFRHATLPDWLRLALIAEMPESLERQVRALLLMLLRGDPADGLISIGVIGDTMPLWQVITGRTLRQEGGPLSEAIFVGFIEGQTINKLSQAVPSTLRDQFIPRFRPEQVVLGLLCAVISILAGWGTPLLAEWLQLPDSSVAGAGIAARIAIAPALVAAVIYTGGRWRLLANYLLSHPRAGGVLLFAVFGAVTGGLSQIGGLAISVYWPFVPGSVFAIGMCILLWYCYKISWWKMLLFLLVASAASFMAIWGSLADVSEDALDGRNSNYINTLIQFPKLAFKVVTGHAVPKINVQGSVCGDWEPIESLLFSGWSGGFLLILASCWILPIRSGRTRLAALLTVPLIGGLFGPLLLFYSNGALFFATWQAAYAGAIGFFLDDSRQATRSVLRPSRDNARRIGITACLVMLAALISANAFLISLAANNVSSSGLFGNGCSVSAPAPQPPPVARPARSYLVFFDLGQSTVTARGTQIAEDAAAAWKTLPPTTHIAVVGHDDTSQTDAQALEISTARANAVADVMIGAGVPKELIDRKGLGQSTLLVPTGPGVREPQNRRVEIYLPPETAQQPAEPAPAPRQAPAARRSQKAP